MAGCSKLRHGGENAEIARKAVFIAHGIKHHFPACQNILGNIFRCGAADERYAFRMAVPPWAGAEERPFARMDDVLFRKGRDSRFHIRAVGKVGHVVLPRYARRAGTAENISVPRGVNDCASAVKPTPSLVFHKQPHALLLFHDGSYNLRIKQDFYAGIQHKFIQRHSEHGRRKKGFIFPAIRGSRIRIVAPLFRQNIRTVTHAQLHQLRTHAVYDFMSFSIADGFIKGNQSLCGKTAEKDALFEQKHSLDSGAPRRNGGADACNAAAGNNNIIFP